MNFDFIKKLLDAAEQFHLAHPGKADLGHFAQWLSASAVESTHVSSIVRQTVPGETLDSNIGKLFIFFNRYAHLYTQKVLAHSGLQSSDEFIFLIYLFNRGTASATEMTDAARLGKLTSETVTQQLIKTGLIEQAILPFESADPILSITDAGQTALLRSFEKMDQVSKLVTGNVSAGEKIQLYQLLIQLETFHRPIRAAFRSEDEDDEESGTPDLFFIDPSSV